MLPRSHHHAEHAYVLKWDILKHIYDLLRFSFWSRWECIWNTNDGEVSKKEEKRREINFRSKVFSLMMKKDEKKRPHTVTVREVLYGQSITSQSLKVLVLPLEDVLHYLQIFNGVICVCVCMWERVCVSCIEVIWLLAFTDDHSIIRSLLLLLLYTYALTPVNTHIIVMNVESSADSAGFGRSLRLILAPMIGERMCLDLKALTVKASNYHSGAEVLTVIFAVSYFYWLEIF